MIDVEKLFYLSHRRDYETDAYHPDQCHCRCTFTTALSAQATTSLTGAGATFPAPVYAKWADSYQKETGNKVNYQGIGSSGGVKQIIANTVDFGASDAPLADEKLKADGLFQFPTVIGGVVMAVNISGIKSGELVLDGETIGNIYLGKIQNGMILL